MDKRGVDSEVVYPTVLLAYITDDVELEVAMCRSYNRYMANAWRVAGDRMAWVVVPPLRDIEASLQEIETARDNGAVGVFFRGVEGDRSLAESYFFPIYEAAQRLGMAISIHTAAGRQACCRCLTATVVFLPHLRGGTATRHGDQHPHRRRLAGHAAGV